MGMAPLPHVRLRTCYLVAISSAFIATIPMRALPPHPPLRKCRAIWAHCQRDTRLHCDIHTHAGSMEMAPLPHDAVQLVNDTGCVVPWPQVRLTHTRRTPT